MDTVTIDFETFWDVDYTLSKSSTTEYVRDPRFQVIGVGILFPESAGVLAGLHWWTEAQFRTWLDAGGRAYLATCAILCHHTHFDGSVLAWHFDVNPAFWLDTLSMSRPLIGADVGGSLKKLALHYGIGEKGDDTRWSKGMHFGDFSAAQWVQYGRYCMNDVQLTWDLYGRLNATAEEAWPGGLSGFPLSELVLIDMTIRMFTEPSFVLDEPRMRVYYESEVKRKADMLARLKQDRSVLMSNPQFAALLISLGVTPPMKESPTTGKPTFAFAAKDLEFQILKEHESPEVRAAVEARLGTKSTINESRSLRMLNIAKGGVPVYLKFAAAHTTRFGGGDKTNMQNLERVDKEDENKGVIRKCLMAPPGYKLDVVDSGQIEARGTACIAGQTDLVAAFRDADAAAAAAEAADLPAPDEDVYTRFASEAYGRKITRKDKKERGVGKTCVLGLGYSMSKYTLAVNMLKGPMGAKPVRFTDEDVDAMGVNVVDFENQVKREMQRLKRSSTNAIDELRMRVPATLSPEQLRDHVAVCARLVDVYRGQNRAITEFWWELCPYICGLMAATAEGAEGPQVGPLVVLHNALRLPSGLCLRYPGLKIDGDSTTYWSGRFRSSLHGGVLTENIVQALSRVVMTDQLLDAAGVAEQKGWRAKGPDGRPAWAVVTTTHDEIVTCVRDDIALEAHADLLRAMKTTPAWAEGWPLNAEGGLAQRYGDAK